MSWTLPYLLTSALCPVVVTAAQGQGAAEVVAALIEEGHILQATYADRAAAGALPAELGALEAELYRLRYGLGVALTDAGAEGLDVVGVLGATLQQDLAVLTRPSEVRIRLLHELAIERLAEGRYADCYDAVAAIEAEFERSNVPRDSRTAGDALLWAPCVLAKCYMAQGLYDAAWEALEVAESRFRARAAASETVRPLALESRFTARFQLLAALERPREALALCEEFYADPRIHPDVVAQFQANRAWMLDDLRRRGEALPAEAPDAETALRAVLANPAVKHRELFHTRLRLAQLHVDGGDLGESRLHLAAARAAASGPVERMRVEGEAAHLAAATGEGRDETWAAWSEAYDAFLDLWAEAPPRETGLGFLNYDDRQAALTGGIALALARGATPEDAFAILLRGHAASGLARALGSAPVTLEALRQDVLGPDAVLLTYVTSARLGFVFALSPTGPLEVHPLAARESWWGRAHRLQDLLDRDPVALDAAARSDRAAELAQVGAEVGRALLPAAVAAEVAAAKVLLVAGVDFLPPCALEVVRIGAEPLGLTHAIAFLPTLPAAVALGRRAPAPRGMGVVLVGDVPEAPGSGRPRLALARADALALLRCWDPARSDALLGADATPERLERVWPDAGLALLLVHGVENRRRMEVGFALAGVGDTPSIVLPSELASWRGSPAVVVANYCGSRRGAARVGEGGGGALVEVLLRSGAEAVAVSLSDLEFRASIALWSECLGQLGPDVSPAEALRRARVALTARGSELADPFSHSRITFHGRAHRPLPLAGAPSAAVAGRGPAPADAARRWPWATAALGTIALAALALWSARARRR